MLGGNLFIMGGGNLSRFGANESVMRWMPDIQLGRRNLSPIQRIAVAEKYRSLYEKEARESKVVLRSYG